MTSQREDPRSITNGTLLIEENTPLPEASLQAGSGWTRVVSRVALEKKLSAAGWTFFYMAGTIRAKVFGFDQRSIIEKALKQLTAMASVQKCNCLDIDLVTLQTFCGIPCVTVTGHSRRIQPGSFFESTADRTT
jgi:hypothetical protein